ncbi:amidohydrolase family protein [Streptomyces sp. YC504]|uniref:Amidohydrolase family protein n=1 Tax=Streptomyces mesophilus TaxID=1775132 RepID=A0A6G4XN57_9ACTN|nr:amidohydrolase family protein [Streptomyces mesophilus]NGO78622.1 amidohydrolase family protein [Streptomyces mesophilus]
MPQLVDHHCHGILREDLTRDGFEAYLTESPDPAPPGTSFFDTQLGFAVRRFCPPLLGLDPHCEPDVYLRERAKLGAEEVARRLLTAAGIAEFYVDTGLPGDLTTPQELAGLSGATAREIVRLEHLAERTAAAAKDPAEFLAVLDGRIAEAARTAAGFKSVVAYRHGLDLPPEPPGRRAVEDALARWLPTGGARITDPVLLRHLLWSAARTGRPLQLHTGFGDPDLRLHRADPLLLTEFIEAVRPTRCTLVLLHCYPYHRQAGYLAQVYPHVYADLGLTLSHTGARATAVLAEMLELTPFGKLLFSTDAHGLPELYLVGARLFRDAAAEVLGSWVERGAWADADADRVRDLVGAGNARRIYA